MDTYERGIQTVGFILLAVLVLVMIRLVSTEERGGASVRDEDRIP